MADLFQFAANSLSVKSWEIRESTLLNRKHQTPLICHEKTYVKSGISNTQTFVLKQQRHKTIKLSRSGASRFGKLTLSAKIQYNINLISHLGNVFPKKNPFKMFPPAGKI